MYILIPFDDEMLLHTPSFLVWGCQKTSLSRWTAWVTWKVGGPMVNGNGNPLQYSCLENPMDRGAWWATVHGVAKGRTRLSDFTFTFMVNVSFC